ncbi:MAG TPA: glycosyltransferase family 39 protein [Flavitalea sp.]|nr:glycosyltransferase family 39 protein [Flavitalea sp.]
MFIKLTGLVLLLIFVSIPLFLHVDSLPFRLWDESRLASNAYEMHKNNNLIVTYYDGAPEMWSTKPPLVIWMQVFFIKLIGFNELAIRLPSALAGLLTCAALLFFSWQYFKNFLPGAFACLILVSTNGYVDIHAIRTGDYDGPLALFTTLFVLAAFLYSEDQNKKWVTLFFTGITLGVLTKSIQPLIFLPGIAIYFILRKRLNLIFNSAFLKGFCIAIFIIASYYITREVMNNGYLSAVWDNEMGGRFFKGLEENNEGPLYYISRAGYLFPYWMFVLPLAIISGMLSKSRKVRQLTIYILIVTVTYFAIITFSKTKLYWYTVPLFPLLSVHIAVFLYQLYDYLKQLTFIRKYHAVSLIIVCMIFIYPYQKIVKKVYHPQEYEWDNMYPVSELLQDAFQGKTSLNNHVIVYRDYDQHLKVYTDALHDKGQIILYKQPDQLVKGDTVIASEPEVYKIIETKYDSQIMKTDHGVKIYVIR